MSIITKDENQSEGAGSSKKNPIYSVRTMGDGNVFSGTMYNVSESIGANGPVLVGNQVFVTTNATSANSSVYWQNGSEHPQFGVITGEAGTGVQINVSETGVIRSFARDDLNSGREDIVVSASKDLSTDAVIDDETGAVIKPATTARWDRTWSTDGMESSTLLMV